MKHLQPHIPTLLLLGTALLAYLPAYTAGFIWDDPDYVINNANLRDLAGLARIWTDPTSIPQWYPMVHTTYWIEFQIWGLWAPGYHTVNIVLHAIGAVLLHRVLLRLGLPGKVALIGALLWSLHPVQVQSVAWVTERKNTLSFVFYMLAGLALLREPRRLLPPLLLYFLALMSKTVTASLPAAYLVMLYWRNGRVTWQDVRFTLPMFVIGAVAGLFTVFLERYHVGAVGPEWDYSFIERCLIAGRAVLFYLQSLVYPLDQAFMYPRWEIDAGVWWQWLFPIAALGLLLGAYLLRGRIGRGPVAGLAFFVGTLIPALGFFNVYPHRYSFVADHFQHIASVGPLVLLGALLARLPPIAPAAVLTVLGILTLLHARNFRDSLTLWTDTLAKNPTGWMVHVNLGLTHSELSEAAPDARTRAFHEQRAFEHMLLAARYGPEIAEAQWNAGVAHANRGDLATAREFLDRALRLDGEFAPAINSLALIELREGNLPEAQRRAQHAVDLQPGFARAHHTLARALAGQGKHARASRHLAAALNLEPGNLQFRVELARNLRDRALAEPDPQRRHSLLADATGHFRDAAARHPHPALREEFERTRALLLHSQSAPPSGTLPATRP